MQCNWSKQNNTIATYCVKGEQRPRSFQTVAGHLQFQHRMHYNSIISTSALKKLKHFYSLNVIISMDTRLLVFCTLSYCTFLNRLVSCWCKLIMSDIIIMPHCSITQMHPIVTDGVAWSRLWALQEWLNRLRCCLGCALGWAPRNQTPHAQGQFWGGRGGPL